MITLSVYLILCWHRGHFCLFCGLQPVIQQRLGGQNTQAKPLGISPADLQDASQSRSEKRPVSLSLELPATDGGQFGDRLSPQDSVCRRVT